MGLVGVDYRTIFLNPKQYFALTKNMSTTNETIFWATVTIIGSAFLIILAIWSLKPTLKSTPSSLESQTGKELDPEQVERLVPAMARYSVTKPDQPAVLKQSQFPNSKISVLMDPTASPRLKRTTSRKDLGMEGMSKPLERSVSKSRIIQSLDNL